MSAHLNCLCESLSKAIMHPIILQNKSYCERLADLSDDLMRQARNGNVETALQWQHNMCFIAEEKFQANLETLGMLDTDYGKMLTTIFLPNVKQQVAIVKASIGFIDAAHIAQFISHIDYQFAIHSDTLTVALENKYGETIW